jgi:hypothetical protein
MDANQEHGPRNTDQYVVNQHLTKKQQQQQKHYVVLRTRTFKCDVQSYTCTYLSKTVLYVQN